MSDSLRIAIADDEPEMRQMLYRAVTYFGHQVISLSESGRQLVSECHQRGPDLVITKIELPDLDGLEAIQEICSIKPVPAIIVSANSDQGVLIRATRLPVFAFLVKPIKMDDLRPAIWLTMQRYFELSDLRLRLESPW